MGDLPIRVVPRSRHSRIDGERNGRILMRVTAPPVDDAANVALCRLIAERAGVPALRVSVVSGRASRDKVVRVEGVAPATLRDSLLR